MAHADDKLLENRITILANGDRLFLRDAIDRVCQIRYRLDETADEWFTLRNLREVCLGNPIDDSITKHLIREGLLAEDGHVDSDLKSVVLSCLRGEGTNVYYDSPFTSSFDRHLCEFMLSRQELEGHLGKDANLLYGPSKFLEELKAFSPDDLDRPKTDHLNKDTQIPSSPPEERLPQKNSDFLDRIIDEHLKKRSKQDNDNSPPSSEPPPLPPK